MKLLVWEKVCRLTSIDTDYFHNWNPGELHFKGVTLMFFQRPTLCWLMVNRCFFTTQVMHCSLATCWVSVMWSKHKPKHTNFSHSGLNLVYFGWYKLVSMLIWPWIDVLGCYGHPCWISKLIVRKFWSSLELGVAHVIVNHLEEFNFKCFFFLGIFGLLDQLLSFPSFPFIWLLSSVNKKLCRKVR